MPNFQTLPEPTLRSLICNCEKRGFVVETILNRDLALRRLIEIIPAGSDVTNGGSVTLTDIGFMKHLESGAHSWRYRRAEILAESDDEKRKDLRRAATTAEYIVGSINALAITGEAVCADAAGTRVGAYTFSAKNVIWVVGTNKVVATLDDAVRRVRSVVLPLEDARMRSTYGFGSWIGKLVVFESEPIANRIRLLLVDESLGF